MRKEAEIKANEEGTARRIIKPKLYLKLHEVIEPTEEPDAASAPEETPLTFGNLPDKYAKADSEGKLPAKNSTPNKRKAVHKDSDSSSRKRTRSSRKARKGDRLSDDE